MELRALHACDTPTTQPFELGTFSQAVNRNIKFYGFDDTFEVLTKYLSLCPQLKNITAYRASPGLMCREVFIPAGSILLGARWAVQHPAFIRQGHCVSWSPKLGYEDLTPTSVILTEVDNRRIVVAVEDTIWCNVLPNPQDASPEDCMRACVINFNELQE